MALQVPGIQDEHILDGPLGVAAGAEPRVQVPRAERPPAIPVLLYSQGAAEECRAGVTDKSRDPGHDACPPTVNMVDDEFARCARLERKINKMVDKLKTHVKARTAQLAKIKWFVSVAFYILQAALMISHVWKHYSIPVAVAPSKWITPLDRL